MIGAVVNAASLNSNFMVAPGEIVSLFGSSWGPSMGVNGQFDDTGRLTTSLSGVSVLFDGKPAPLFYAGAGQINAQAPASVASSYSVGVRVQYNGLTSDESQVEVQPASPGIFGSVTSQGRGAAIINADGTINSAANPAVRGSVVSMFATGGGMTVAPVPDGVPEPGAASLSLPVGVAVNGAAARIFYAGSAPSYAGVTQVNLEIPDDLKVRSGLNTLLLSVGAPSNADISGVFVK